MGYGEHQWFGGGCGGASGDAGVESIVYDLGSRVPPSTLLAQYTVRQGGGNISNFVVWD